MSLIGACVYYFDPTVGHKLSLLQPHFVVVGSGAWTDIDAIAGACAPTQPLLIMRGMADNLIDHPPLSVVGMMSEQARQYPEAIHKRVILHGLNESYSDVLKALAWELAFIDGAHALGYRTICLNGSYGNDPDERFKDVADASDYVGWHLYDGYMEDAPNADAHDKFVARVHTSRRYERESWPKWWPKRKHIATETGIEAFPSTGSRRGWHDMKIPEETVRLRMLANALHWKADGLLGVCWFTAGHTEQSWNEGYGMTEGMAKLWGEKGPLPTIPANGPVVTPTPPVVPNGGNHMAGLTQKEYDAALPKIDAIYGDLNDFDGFESANDILIPAKVGYLEQQKRTVQNMRKALLELKEILVPKT